MNELSVREKPAPNPPPHVVLLGAGASRAAFPHGDKNGKQLPLLDDLPELLGETWSQLVSETEVPSGDFESQYSWIKSKPAFLPELELIEKRLKSYFKEMELPDCPTIYDYLVLGLRKTDVIGTFNWDPLLLQAHERNRGICSLPDLRFLHGCVSFSTCETHDILGSEGQVCPLCKSRLVTGRLLYPEADKDYTRNSFIKRDWEFIQKAIERSFHLTIFGYSAPATDYKAREILLDAWGEEESRGSCHVELIDIASSSALSENWRDFIPYDHMMPVSCFFDSSIARWPRRTFEWKRNASIYGMPSQDVGIFKTDSLQEVQDWFTELAMEEDRAKAV
ncbi:MAG: hypothetical protein KJ626_13785 [Verrucomicrobia bacterium]|nr:hypothetical protein [Verrucomicrobiota bacterium]